ncbi:MAG TPA: FAD-dependent oxidoreductase [Chitinophagaceae bacterium]|nr:FAD-dependent oxidoreductase [Chitinophagaceae bacterium]
MKRRKFIKNVSVLAAGGSLMGSCATSSKKIPGKIIGASSAVGHLMRDGKLNSKPVSETMTVKVAVIGSGVSGLSAARQLLKNKVEDFVLLELEPHAGGNAHSGSNDISAYPWGAHYVPLPNNDLKEYLSFLEEAGVITSYNGQGLPVYNEYHLCFAPEERLFINGLWQHGLIPNFGVGEDEQQQIKRFLLLMDEFRNKKGNDGRDAFSIPVNNSSQDEVFLLLDKMSMKEWLQQNGFTSPHLHWYCNYACRDDFGTRYDECSAWAGIHYFAGRKGKAANADSGDVITWPEGNGFLVKHLMKEIGSKIKTNSLVTGIKQDNNKVEIVYWDVAESLLKKVVADFCIISTPMFITQRLLNYDKAKSDKVHNTFHYCPWMVANITVKELEEKRGEDLCWDNVLYESESLGYVEATHQLVNQLTPRKNLTYYLPLTKTDPVTERKKAIEMKHEDWVKIILDDLKKVHTNIETAVEKINVMIWGHAMIQPRTNYISGTIRKELSHSGFSNIELAHTDIAGISIFEEAFYQGINAADSVIKKLAS